MPQSSPHTDPSAAENGPELRAHPCLALAQQVAILGRQTKRILAASIDDGGLSDTQLLLLWVCADAGSHGIPQNQMASRLGLSTAQVSGHVERLSQDGLIVECANSGDRRRRLWTLPDAGRDRLDRAIRRLDPHASELEARFTEARLAELLRLLAGANQALQELLSDSRSTTTLRLFPATPPPNEAATCRGPAAADLRQGGA